MAEILIRGVPTHVVDSLKRRAAAHRRSMQQELLAILEDAVAMDVTEAEKLASRVRKKLAETGRKFSDSAELVREDRQR